MISSNDLRNAFLNFFSEKGHSVIPSSSLVPSNDPTLLFVNAGMVQFKDIFIGKEQSPHKCATTAQKCVRAGGKHNDLDQVGYTARHHTFFEMLGNFSFGDYFKGEAISFAWEFLTKRLSLPKDRLLVTVYHEDTEAAKLWKKIANLDDKRIIPISTSDNFWSMGETGPCGPCSEIFYDHGESIAGGIPGSADQDGDRFVEIWNIVFMQFEQLADGRKIALPKPSIDTGMGIERLAAVLQNVHDNYETDIIKNSILDINKFLNRSLSDFTPSHKVIADHVRSICFLLADGITPNNEGRGYVLRRIIRRAVRHAQKLGASNLVFLPKVAETFMPRMSSHYRELEMFHDIILSNITKEEERFRQTLDKGLTILEQESKKLGNKKILSGEIAFRMYDTYGFPIDLTEDILREKGISVDNVSFKECYDKQRILAKKSWSGSGDTSLSQSIYDIKKKLNGQETLSVAYDCDDNQSSVLALLGEEGQIIDSIECGTKGAIIASETCFYAESGGQIGDIGLITSDNAKFQVDDTKKFQNIIVHYGRVTSGQFSEKDQIHLKINTLNRSKLRANHSATHLLHSALRQVLGDSVVQKGSFVSVDRLRFDFSYHAQLTAEQINQVEMLVNKWIQDNLSVSISIVSKDAAIKSGAIALFGDKYGDKVRLVTMKDNHSTISAELCGGLHVNKTGVISVFKIIEQSGIGTGIRRLEAITGVAVFNYAANFEHTIKDLCAILKCSMNELVGKCTDLISSIDQLKAKNAQLKLQIATEVISKDDISSTIGDIHFYGKSISNLESNEPRLMMDKLKAKHKEKSIIALANVGLDNKVSLLIGVSSDITSRYPANFLIKNVIGIIGGIGSGGRQDLAQGGGNLPSKIQEAFKEIHKIISS